MKFTLSLLAGLFLLSPPGHAQGRTSTGQSLDQLFSAVIRSSVTSPAPPSGPGIKTPSELNKETLKLYCEKIVKDDQRFYYLKDRNGKMKLQVRGIYAGGPALFFLLRLNNRSPIDYEVDGLRFFIVETRSLKGGYMQPKALSPMYVYDSTVLVRGYSHTNSVIVLPRFTLSPGRQLLIEVREKEGGRHLRIQATNFVLERARLI